MATVTQELTAKQKLAVEKLRERYDTVHLEHCETGVQAFCHGPNGLAIFPLRP